MMTESSEKRSFINRSMMAMGDILMLALRAARKGATQDTTRLKETKIVLSRIAAVRRKHKRDRRHLAVMWLASWVTLMSVLYALGAYVAVAVFIAACVVLPFLGRFMRIGYDIAPTGYDPDNMDDLMATFFVARRISEGPEDEDEGEGLLVRRDDAPAIWDAVRWLSKKTGLPLPRVRIIDDPKTTAHIAPWDNLAEIVIDGRMLKFISGKSRTARTRVLLAHEYAHWIENDWRRSTCYRTSVALLGGIALASLIAFVSACPASFLWPAIDLRLCVEGMLLSVVAALLAVAFGTIGFVKHGLAAESAADAIAAHLVGSRKKAADFFFDGVEEGIGNAYEEYCPFRGIMHPPMKARARAILEDS